MKNALITGATKGMGHAIALAFAKEGINLAICSRNIKDLQQTREQLLAVNPDITVSATVADASIKQQLLQFAQQAEQQLGNISVIVNNVGTFIPSSILDDTDDTFDNQINTNLRPGYELYRHFGKKLIEAKQGHIFNICSVASLSPVVNAGTYSVTKAAVYSLSNIMRLEMQQYGIKVTSVIPGSTITASWDGVEVDKSRFVLPEDVASAIVTIYKMSEGANVDKITIKPVFGQL